MLFLLISLLNLQSLAQTCPGSDEVQAVVSQPFFGNKRIFVCGFEDITQESPKGRKLLNDFSVYFEKEGTSAEKLFGVGAESNYWVTADKKSGLLFEEVQWVADRYVPLFRSYVVCKEKECIHTTPECVVPTGKPKYPEMVRQIDKKIRGKFSKIAEPVSMMIQFVLLDVLAGDKKSAQFFESNKIMDKVDVQAGQQFLVSKKIYDRIKESGCLLEKTKKSVLKAKKNVRAKR